MSKLYLADPNSYDVKIGKIKRHFAHKVDVYPPGSCPLTLQLSFLRTSAGQTCGKCVPCRDGLPLVARLLQKVVDGAATQKTLDNIKMMATMIRDSSDCAIGWNAADEVLKGLDLFADEYQNHIKFHKCEESIAQKVPCISLCPAHIDIPGYIALIGEGDYAGAVNMVRRDNPFPTACGMVCEHNTNVGKDIPIAKIQKEHDAMFVAIGAQVGKTLRMPGADAQNVFSAVEMLDDIGNGHMPDYTGKTVIVIGGGNVAMDAARSAVRCGAKEVSCVYRRRQKDMTALNTEIESAIMEGVVLVTLQSPVEITKHKDGTCSGLTTQPQKISTYRGGRPGVVDAAKPTQHFDADVILIAVGQDIVSAPFEEFGMKAEHNIFVAGLDTEVENMPGIYVGGDCATGPSTVIRAIAAGKVAAHNIDEYLGYHHKLHCEAVSPEPKENIRTLIGRTEIGERPAFERKKDFECVEEEMTYEEAMQECSRCLRCDHFGCGAMEGGTDI